MATSLHENILARVLALIDFDEIETCARNLETTDDMQLPAAILHDGTETAAENINAVGGAGNAVTIEPQITILFSSESKDAGPTKSAWLALLQKTLLLDTTLATLCRGTRPSGVRYVGSEFSYASGQGELIAQFAITYPFNPRAL